MDHRPPSIKVDKPWGRFEQYTHNLPCTVKIITVAPGGTLSRQYHHKRDELWVVLDEGARVELGEEVLGRIGARPRSEEHTSELQSRQYLVCRLLLEKKKK